MHSPRRGADEEQHLNLRAAVDVERTKLVHAGLGNTEFTLGRQVAGEWPDTFKIAENDGATAVRSTAMCELGKRSR